MTGTPKPKTIASKNQQKTTFGVKTLKLMYGFEQLVASLLLWGWGQSGVAGHPPLSRRRRRSGAFQKAQTGVGSGEPNHRTWTWRPASGPGRPHAAQLIEDRHGPLCVVLLQHLGRWLLVCRRGGAMVGARGEQSCNMEAIHPS